MFLWMNNKLGVHDGAGGKCKLERGMWRVSDHGLETNSGAGWRLKGRTERG